MIAFREFIAWKSTESSAIIKAAANSKVQQQEVERKNEVNKKYQEKKKEYKSKYGSTS